jgi:hypothetical protein
MSCPVTQPSACVLRRLTVSAPTAWICVACHAEATGSRGSQWGLSRPVAQRHGSGPGLTKWPCRVKLGDWLRNMIQLDSKWSP